MKKVVLILFFIVSTTLVASAEPLLQADSNEQLYRWTLVGTGALAAGEALALSGGLGYSGVNSWFSPKNTFFVISDVLMGSLFIYCGWSGSQAVHPVLLSTSGAVFTATHSWRSYEYITGGENPFCFNTPLFVVNNIKLAGSSLALAVSLMVIF